MGYPRGQRSRAMKVATEVSVASRSSSTFADIAEADVTLDECQAGDVIVVHGTVYIGGEAVRFHVDIGTYVGTTFTHFGSSADGSFMHELGTVNQFNELAFFANHTLVEGDIVDGVVTFRWRFKTNGGAAKTFGVRNPVVQNIGPTQ